MPPPPTPCAASAAAAAAARPAPGHPAASSPGRRGGREFSPLRRPRGGEPARPPVPGLDPRASARPPRLYRPGQPRRRRSAGADDGFAAAPARAHSPLPPPTAPPRPGPRPHPRPRDCPRPRPAPQGPRSGHSRRFPVEAPSLQGGTTPPTRPVPSPGGLAALSHRPRKRRCQKGCLLSSIRS